MFNLKNLRTFFARNKFSLLEKESTQFLCNIAIDLGQMFLSREVSTMNTKNEKDTACNITLHRSLDFFFFFLLAMANKIVAAWNTCVLF